ILVDHHTINDLAVLNLTTGNLLNTGVALYVDLLLSTTSIEGDRPDRLESQVAHEFRPPRHELRPDGRLDQLIHLVIVVNVDGRRNLLDNSKGVCQSTLESRDDDDRVDVAFELGDGLGKHFTGYPRQHAPQTPR